MVCMKRNGKITKSVFAQKAAVMRDQGSESGGGLSSWQELLSPAAHRLHSRSHQCILGYSGQTQGSLQWVAWLNVMFLQDCEAGAHHWAWRDDEFGASADCHQLTAARECAVKEARHSGHRERDITIKRSRYVGRLTSRSVRSLGRNNTLNITAPEFVLMSPDLPPSVADVVQPLAAAGHVTNVDMLQHREAQDVFEQLGRQVGQSFSVGLGNNPI